MSRALKWLLLLGFILPSVHCAHAKRTKEQQTLRAAKARKTRKRVRIPKDPFARSRGLAKIYDRQAKRAKFIQRYKKTGAVGETEWGRLMIRDQKKLSKRDGKRLNKLVSLENKDRERIFSAIMKGLAGNRENQKAMRLRYFEQNLANDSKGTYYFRADHWQQK